MVKVICDRRGNKDDSMLRDLHQKLISGDLILKQRHLRMLLIEKRNRIHHN
jgi:hypothetical protein